MRRDAVFVAASGIGNLPCRDGTVRVDPVAPPPTVCGGRVSISSQSPFSFVGENFPIAIPLLDTPPYRTSRSGRFPLNPFPPAYRFRGLTAAPNTASVGGSCEPRCPAASGITTAGIVSRAGEAYDAQARSLKRCGEEFASTERRRKWQRRKARRSRTRVEKENRTNYCANGSSGRWWRGTQASNCSRQPPSAFTRTRSSFASAMRWLLLPCPSRAG